MDRYRRLQTLLKKELKSINDAIKLTNDIDTKKYLQTYRQQLIDQISYIDEGVNK